MVKKSLWSAQIIVIDLQLVFEFDLSQYGGTINHNKHFEHIWNLHIKTMTKPGWDMHKMLRRNCHTQLNKPTQKWKMWAFQEKLILHVPEKVCQMYRAHCTLSERGTKQHTCRSKIPNLSLMTHLMGRGAWRGRPRRFHTGFSPIVLLLSTSCSHSDTVETPVWFLLNSFTFLHRPPAYFHYMNLSLTAAGPVEAHSCPPEAEGSMAQTWSQDVISNEESGFWLSV